ncbi:hypothetical protein SUNI508_12053 [Seiridium unicorne]|uniref:Uncharacterized protein n=1 Tax=Seiridium unicorne TaxID=138068 RepID=A0ABR2UEW7_9PEZI
MLAGSEALQDFRFFPYDGVLPSECSPGRELSVRRDAYWSYCGPMLPASPDRLPDNLYEWEIAALSGSIVPHLLPLLSFVNDFIAKQGLDNYWITLRATTATLEYDKARWHTDDMFFSSRKGDEKRSWGLGTIAGKRQLDLKTDWKICATLLGPSTLFIPTQHQQQARKRQKLAKERGSVEHSCTSIRCIGCATAADAVRDDLAAGLAEFGAAQAKTGECAVFRIGAKNGAVHSEPSMSHGGRVFVNIVPGKKEELSSLLSRWAMEFPRSWWMSPSVTGSRDHNVRVND